MFVITPEKPSRLLIAQYYNFLAVVSQKSRFFFFFGGGGARLILCMDSDRNEVCIS